MDTSRLSVELTNFRCHSHFVITVDPNKIYHLVGDSGNGKTTILEAIYWCLYGSKGAKVAPLKATPKTSTIVKLTLITKHHNVVLTRKTNAHVFHVTYKTSNGTYNDLEGETAQVYVEELFGSSGLWMSTSYLRQKSFNPFLQGSASDKRKILNRLAFRHDTTEHIDKIMDNADRMVNMATAKREALYTQFQSNMERYTLSFSENNVNVDDVSADVHLTSPAIEEKLSMAQSNLFKLQVILKRSAEDVGECKRLEYALGTHTSNPITLEVIERQRNELTAILDQLDIHDKRKIVEDHMAKKNHKLKYLIDTNRKALDDVHATTRSMEIVQNNLAALTPPQQPTYLSLPQHPNPDTMIPPIPVSTIPPAYTQRDLQHALAVEQHAQFSANIALSFNIPNTTEAVQQELIRLTTQLQSIREYAKQESVHQSNRAQKARLTQQLSELYTHQVSYADALPALQVTLSTLQLQEHTQRQRLAELQKAVKVRPLECPHCKGCVIITQQQTLAPIDAFNPAEYQREICDIQNSDISSTIVALQRRIADETKFQNLQNTLHSDIHHITSDIQPIDSNIISLPEAPPGNENEVCRFIAHIKGWEPAAILSVSSADIVKSMEVHALLEKRNHQVAELRQQQKLQTQQTQIENDQRKLAYERALVKHDQERATLQSSLFAKEHIIQQTLAAVEVRKDEANRVQLEFEALEAELGKLHVSPVNKTREMVWKEVYALADMELNIIRLEELRSSQRVIMYEKRVQKEQQLQAEVAKLNQRLVYLEKCRNIATQRDHLVSLRSDFESAQTRESKAIELRDGMVRIQHSRFALSTARINMLLSTIVGEMYTKPISVHLKMFKTAKTTKRTKPSVNLCVSMDNEEIDVNVISGGESDRLSIALTLALSKVRESPILLLDECFASLPANDRERTITSIVAHGKAQDRFFFCIAPNSSSGWFEKEIPIGS